MATVPTTIDEYIASFPDDARRALEQVRSAVHRVVPDATETIKYGMPTFTGEGHHNVYFAGWKTHVALYAVPPLPAELETRVAPLRSDKDTVKFPLSEPMPVELVQEVVAELVRRHD
ncbi:MULTISPECIES: DUF1801 domain-containing protein [unclassified Diaminobutyricimonas]|uniref:iron chaperone n=1 Tax=unclassified Diaminobutyricimonas TaxID=2643261 RepID=UPI0012F511FF|nr:MULTISPECIES: DUF1801 domain-containing protein [unclassified Diaminobutyricimonas]